KPKVAWLLDVEGGAVRELHFMHLELVSQGRGDDALIQLGLKLHIQFHVEMHEGAEIVAELRPGLFGSVAQFFRDLAHHGFAFQQSKWRKGELRAVAVRVGDLLWLEHSIVATCVTSEAYRISNDNRK